MKDWKEGVIEEYLKVERMKKGIEQDMTRDVDLSQLKTKMDAIKQQIHVEESGYNIRIENVNAQLQHIKEEMIEQWDINDKSFKCNKGSATIRITRALKVNDKEKLISTLQQIGKLTQCIKGWDLTYLRKLADAGMFDVDVKELNIVHYDEKRNVIISDVKNGGAVKDDK